MQLIRGCPAGRLLVCRGAAAAVGVCAVACPPPPTHRAGSPVRRLATAIGGHLRRAGLWAALNSAALTSAALVRGVPVPPGDRWLSAGNLPGTGRAGAPPRPRGGADDKPRTTTNTRPRPARPESRGEASPDPGRPRASADTTRQIHGRAAANPGSAEVSERDRRANSTAGRGGGRVEGRC